MPDVSTLALNSGVELPALGLGVFQTPAEETRAAVEAALAAGYRHTLTQPLPTATSGRSEKRCAVLGWTGLGSF
jgi:diketogulonate reductase-like aldo/keto reductase